MSIKFKKQIVYIIDTKKTLPKTYNDNNEIYPVQKYKETYEILTNNL